MKTEDVNLVKKTIRWMRQADTAIGEAHGNPKYLINMFPEQLLEHLIRNNIYLTYTSEDS